MHRDQIDVSFLLELPCGRQVHPLIDGRVHRSILSLFMFLTTSVALQTSRIPIGRGVSHTRNENSFHHAQRLEPSCSVPSGLTSVRVVFCRNVSRSPVRG